MPVYTVTRRSDGAEVHRYAAAAVVEAAWPLADFEHAELADDGSPVAYAGPWQITKFAFRSRFTQAEKVGIEIASLDDPAAPMEQRALAATLRANQMDVAAAEFVDLKRPDTRAGVQALEQYGLIAAGRAAAILDTEPTDAEVWRG